MAYSKSALNSKARINVRVLSKIGSVVLNFCYNYLIIMPLFFTFSSIISMKEAKRFLMPNLSLNNLKPSTSSSKLVYIGSFTPTT